MAKKITLTYRTAWWGQIRESQLGFALDLQLWSLFRGDCYLLGWKSAGCQFV